VGQSLLAPFRIAPDNLESALQPDLHANEKKYFLPMTIKFYGFSHPSIKKAPSKTVLFSQAEPSLTLEIT